MIRVMIVDDQYIVRSGLATFISICPDLELVAEARDGEEAVRLCAQTLPDVILMDLMMPHMNGVEATRAILKQQPTVRVLALTSFKEKELIHEVLNAGAIGYLLKDVSADELASAIRNVYNGGTVLAPAAMQVLLDRGQSTLSPVIGQDLTEREKEVLSLLIDGYSNPQIAKKLVLSLSTVKTHVSNILAKFQATTRTEAVTFALRHKIQ